MIAFLLFLFYSWCLEKMALEGVNGLREILALENQWCHSIIGVIFM